MSKILSALLLSGVLTFAACKQKTDATTASEEPSRETLFTSPFMTNVGGTYTALATIRSQATALIDNRIMKDGNAQASLTFAYWYPEFIFNKKMSNVDEFAGHWIKFEDDFSYRYGRNDESLGGGKYHFRLDDGALVMLDNNEDVEPKFWKVQHNGQAMAFVGLHELSINNGMQMKLISLDESPGSSVQSIEQ